MKSKHWSFGLKQESCSVAEKHPVNKNNMNLYLNFILQKFFSHITGLVNRNLVWLASYNTN